MRPTPIGIALLVATAAAVMLAPFAPGASLVAAGIAGLVLLAAALDAVGHADAYLLEADARGAQRAADRKRSALSRLSGDRGWDRRCPDAPDEPVDEIWARERRRREAR